MSTVQSQQTELNERLKSLEGKSLTPTSLHQPMEIEELQICSLDEYNQFKNKLINEEGFKEKIVSIFLFIFFPYIFIIIFYFR